MNAPDTPAVAGTIANRLSGAFYAVVAATALAGQVQAAHHWLEWPLLFALPAVAALELGGIALAARADFRRRLGERAYAAQFLSFAVAVFAVVFNWLGHDNHIAGGFFAGMSALGYGVWLINAGDRRRDQLRAAGKLPPTPPVYGLAQWVRHPALTRRARALAVVDPALGVHGSLTAAAEAIRIERQHAAIAKALHRKLTDSLDPVAAEIAVRTYDLDRIAAGLAERADYDGLTDLLAADLTPERLAGQHADTEPATDADNAADTPESTPDTGTATSAANGADTGPATGADVARPTKRTPARTAKRSRKPDTATAVQRLAAKHPALSTADIAARVGVSPRTARRYLNPTTDTETTAAQSAA